MQVSAKVLKAMRAFTNPKDKKYEVCHKVHYRHPGRLYATDSFRVVGLAVDCEDAPEEDFSVPDELFDRLKATDVVDLTDEACSVGKWSIPVEPKGEDVDFEALLSEGRDDDDELPLEGLPVEPTYLVDACALAAAIGGDALVDEYPKRIVISSRNRELGVRATMAIMGKVSHK